MTGWRVFVRFRSVQHRDLGATVRVWPVEKGITWRSMLNFRAFSWFGRAHHRRPGCTWTALVVVSSIGVLCKEGRENYWRKFRECWAGREFTPRTPTRSRSLKRLHITTGPHKRAHQRTDIEITSRNACKVSNRIRAFHCFVSLS